MVEVFSGIQNEGTNRAGEAGGGGEPAYVTPDLSYEYNSWREREEKGGDGKGEERKCVRVRVRPRDR